MISFNENTVEFLGTEINCVQAEDGTVCVPLKTLCEILGINYRAQASKLKKSPLFSGKIVSIPGQDGRKRGMLCLPVEEVYGWLFRINRKSVRPEMMAKIVKYQDESKMALRHYEQHRLALNPHRNPEEVESAVRDALDRIIERMLPDHCTPQQRRLALLLGEIALFGRFAKEPPPYSNLAFQCIAAAHAAYDAWLADLGPILHVIRRSDQERA